MHFLAYGFPPLPIQITEKPRWGFKTTIPVPHEMIFHILKRFPRRTHYCQAFHAELCGVLRIETLHIAQGRKWTVPHIETTFKYMKLFA